MAVQQATCGPSFDLGEGTGGDTDVSDNNLSQNAETPEVGTPTAAGSPISPTSTPDATHACILGTLFHPFR